jgi:nucleoid-associated protein YgaU
MDEFASKDDGGDPFSESPSTGKSATVASSEQTSVEGDPFGATSTPAARPSAAAGKSLPALPTSADDPFGKEVEPVETATATPRESSPSETSDPFTAEPAVTKKSEPAAAVALPVLGSLETEDSRPTTNTPELTGIESQDRDFGADTAAMAEREPVREANADPFSAGPAMSFEPVEERPEPRTFPAAKSAQPVELLPEENTEPSSIAERKTAADPFGGSSEPAPRLEPVPETRSIPVDPFPAEEIPTNRPVIAEQPKIAAPAAMENDPFGRPTPSETEPPARTPTMVGSSPDGFEPPVEVSSPTFEPANRTPASSTLLPGIGVGVANADVRQPQADDYQIQEGDSFWSVSRSIYGTGRYWKALQAFNADRVPDPNRMKLGTRLATPPTDVLERMHANLIPRAAIPEVAIQPSSGVTNLGGEQPGFFIGDQGVPMYRVGSEDTLSTIAERHLGRSSRWIQVFEMNRDTLKNGNDLKIGAVLRLPADASQVQLVSDR